MCNLLYFNLTMTQNQFLNNLSLFELQWYAHHLMDSPKRLSIAQALLAKSAGEFSYQSAGFSRHQVYDFINYYEKTCAEWDLTLNLEKVADWNEKLMKGEGLPIALILEFLERDAFLCRLRNRFCFPKSEWLRFLLKQLKDYAFVQRDYGAMNRLIILDDFYGPYFQVNDEVHSFARKINHAIRFLDWKKLKDIIGLTNAYLSKHRNQLCMTTKLVLYRFLIGQYYNEKQSKELDGILSAIFEEQCLQPYASRVEFDVLSLITFFNNYTQVGDYKAAIRYYRKPKLDLNSVHFQGNIYAYLGIALESYDLKLSEQYIAVLLGQSISEIRPIVLHLMARYFLLQADLKQVESYISVAIEVLKGKNSYELFFETYSVYLRFLFQTYNYSEILEVYKQSNVKKMLKKSDLVNMHNFEFQLYYLLAKYRLGKLKEERFNLKVYQLLVAASSIKNGFMKLRIIENMQKIEQIRNIRLENRNKQFLTRLQIELVEFSTISDLNWA